MFHAGLALELSRIIWDDRRAEARAGQGRPGRSRRVRTPGPPTAPARGRLAGGLRIAGDDPWWAWRVVEPDAEYLRRRAA